MSETSEKLLKIKKFMGRYSFLLISFIFFFILTPLTSNIIGGIAHYIFMTFIMVASIYSISENKKYLILGLILVILSIAGNWIDLLDAHSIYSEIFFLFQPLFLFYTVILIIKNLLTSEEVTDDLIIGSVCAFMILGLAWGMLYIFIFNNFDNAFVSTRIPLDYNDLIYFSFVTLTTLGYGDITPHADIACSLNILEAVTGLFFATTIVARLVSIHITQKIRNFK